MASVNCCQQADHSWDEFVTESENSTIYHTSQWCEFLRETFGNEIYYLMATEPDGATSGVLPLCHVKSPLLGSRLVSMPYANYGGPIARFENTKSDLRQAAIKLALELGAPQLEIRETGESIGGSNMAVRREKAIMLLRLPGSNEEYSQAIGSKVRSQIRRPRKEGATAFVGGSELLPQFYDVFAQNMRDLGTPVYPFGFFEDFTSIFKSNINVVLVRIDDLTIAAGMLVRWKNTLEIPWAASIRRYNHTGANMLLYWTAITFAIESECEFFDFGRSSIDSGTYRFKKQWLAEPVPCSWNYWPPESAESTNSMFRKYATVIWQKLPLWLANRIGPSISPKLPW